MAEQPQDTKIVYKPSKTFTQHDIGITTLTATENWIVSAGADSSIHTWKVDAAGLVKDSTVDGLYGGVMAMDGRNNELAVTTSCGTVKLYDLRTADIIGTLDGQVPNTHAIAYAGSLLVSGGTDGQINLWDIRQQKALKTETVSDSAITYLCTDDMSTSVAYGTSSGVLGLLNAETGEKLRETKAHAEQIRQIVWTDQDTLVSCSTDKTFCIHNRDKFSSAGQKSGVSMIAHHSAVQGVAKLSNDSIVTVGDDKGVKVWTLPKPNEDQPQTYAYWQHNDITTCVASHKTGDWFVVGTFGERALHFYRKMEVEAEE